MIRRFVWCAFVSLTFTAAGATARSAEPEPPEGVLPAGADGKPLNLDFETGTLKDWTAEGAAFDGQPVKGDTVAPRRGDMKSRHQGTYWIGTYEVHGDQPQGTLTSVPFTVTRPWASFLVGGGPHPSTCVELVRADTGAVLHRASGQEAEDMSRDVVDLHDHLGKKIFIRVVDRHSGHWGHVNFDDFRLHATRPKVARPAGPDVYAHAGLTPERGAAAMTVPEGFTVTAFAGEPDVRQPIALCLDDRGRVWVAESYTYPTRRPDKDAKDRIVIFEDTDGDGRFDKRTVFMEGLNLISGLELGHGGVWIGAAPYFMFVPVHPGEDKPAGPPVILLDGWGYQDTHETLNTFTWGPDGWLYGCHGVFTHSLVGKPGTPNAQRTPINAGVWRYHPKKHVFEVFAHGTSNPWGLDFNDHGQAFVEACVIPHVYHIIQGARYQRQAGEHFNPYTYDDIKTIADHLHWQGANQWAANNRSDTFGGGHAHCGTMIYLGGAWPEAYRNQMFMGNIHGRRLNMDRLAASGSGYVASHGPDFLLANDAWARFINFRYGPDGNVYLIDWYDKQACHTGNVDAWDRTNGRVYKISYRGTKVVRPDLAKLTTEELAALQLSPNDWYVRHARRLLAERGGTPAVHADLEKIAFENPDETRRLRGLWALHVTDGLTADRIGKGLADKSAHVRAWTIQLALEAGAAPPRLVPALAEMARTDPSPVVRLYLASGLQRLPVSQRWDIVEGLVAHAEDANDHNLPLMDWYAAEPLAAADPARALALAGAAKVPTVLPFMVRRIGAIGTPAALTGLVEALSRTTDTGTRRVFLRGLTEALKGRRNVPMPAAWPAAYAALADAPDADLRAGALALGVTFGDAKALDGLRAIVSDTKAPPAARKDALAVLLEARDATLVPRLQALLADPGFRDSAIRGLAGYDDEKTPGLLLDAYPALTSEEKRAALNTLAARPRNARALLDAVAAKKVAPAEVSADIVRQMRILHDAALDKRIAEVWGSLRPTPAARAQLIAQHRAMLTRPGAVKPDPALGRAVFAKTCQQCHTLFGVGGKVGPDITGSNRANLDYLLENILDPSAVIPKEYALSVIVLNSGRVVSGIVRAETPAALTVVTPTETLSISKDDVESRSASDVSMMPDDLVKPLAEHELRSLVAYLQGPAQAPLLATPDNARDFFNGKDLTNWEGDARLWRVDNGEIVGTSPGIRRNEFLRSRMIADDFRLTLRVKLTPDAENSGVQFHSEELPTGEVKGPQADIGRGWWGKLYEEHGRGLLWPKSGEPAVKPNDWNTYEIVATGSKVRTFINGTLCVDLDDPELARRGLFAFQIHSGGAMEVRFKDVKLEVGTPRK